VKFWNDYGSTFAMAYPVKDAKQGQTFMVFAQIKGIAGDVTTDCSDRNIIPYYKGTWASLRRVDSIDEYKRTVYQATLFRGNGQQRRGHGVTVPLSRVRLKELVEEVTRRSSHSCNRLPRILLSGSPEPLSSWPEMPVHFHAPCCRT